MNSRRLQAAERSGVNLSIQGLRGLASVSVLVDHLHSMGTKVEFWPPATSGFVAHFGLFSVCLFFCISGYLIATTLTKHGDVRRFAVNRMRRIYPVFILLHLVMFTVGPLANYRWMGALRDQPVAYLGHFFSNLFFLPGIFDLPIAQKNAWSLSYEALFYIVASMVFIGQRVGASTMVRMLGWLAWGLSLFMIWHEPLMLFFTVGVSLWWLERQGRLPERGFPSWLYLVGILVGFQLFSLRGESMWWPVVGLPFVAFFFAGVVLDRGGFLGVLRSAPMNFLGKISYSLYLVHPFVLDPIRKICVKFGGEGPTNAFIPLFIVVGFCLAITVAWISYELVEVRFTRLISYGRLAKVKEAAEAA
tara:strand:- start:418 stop:1500 length:1083 start_codon:yes stop_codon:yes gene_type:complete